MIRFFISKGISEYYVLVEKSDYLSSDYSPVILTVSEIKTGREKSPQLQLIKSGSEMLVRNGRQKAFDRLLHQGLKYKIHKDLPLQFYEIIRTYSEYQFF